LEQAVVNTTKAANVRAGFMLGIVSAHAAESVNQLPRYCPPPGSDRQHRVVFWWDKADFLQADFSTSVFAICDRRERHRQPFLL
jgi:hypothetical protein